VLDVFCQKEQTALPEVRAIYACTAESCRNFALFRGCADHWQGVSCSCPHHMSVIAPANENINSLLESYQIYQLTRLGRGGVLEGEGDMDMMRQEGQRHPA